MFAITRSRLAHIKQVRSFSYSATSTKANMRFIFLAYDHTDPGALERRLAVRQEHLKEAVPDKRNGFILEGGAILDNHTSKNMIGSSMLIEAESEEAAWDRLRRDIYCTGNVWNMEKATLIPVINGFKDVK